MHVRDASGRKVSLLNDDTSYPPQPYPVLPRLSYRSANHVVSQRYCSGLSTRSASSSPHTPQLFRSDSFGSSGSNEPLSPMTPNVMYADYGNTAVYSGEIGSPYDDCLRHAHGAPTASKLPAGAFARGSSRSLSYEDDSASPISSSYSGGGDRSAAAVAAGSVGKRYPCRYRDSHGCEKTFTTSGHASRHSKIHTAEKAVQCTHAGCSKKFTRADNMKQHLETHYKDKSRSSPSRPAVSGRRSSSSSKHGDNSSGRAGNSSIAPLPSPGVSGGAWDMRALNLPLMDRPSLMRNPNSGLDALAMAVACQEGA